MRSQRNPEGAKRNMPSHFSRRDIASFGVVAACSAALTKRGFARQNVDSGPSLYRTADPEDLIAAARAIVATGVHTTLASVDSAGMPRARTMAVYMPEDCTTFWMSTRPSSRKLDQFANNSKASLHFSDAEQWGYATFMGSVVPHADEKTVTQRSFFPEGLRNDLFPDFPNDMVMLEFKPSWLEVAERGISVQQDTWQPQGLLLD